MTTADDTPRYGPALANPRIAFVVFNAMTHDTRVIREAQAAMAAGATVRVFAYGGKHIGLMPAGIDQVDGVEVERVRISSLAAIVFALLALRKRLRRSSASAAAGTAQAPSKPGTTAVVASPLLPASVLNGPLGAVLRQGLRMDVTLRQISFWLRATRAVRAWGPDLVHAHDANTLMVVGHAARKLKVPFVYDSHELWTKRNVSGARPVARRLEGPMERFWIRRAGAVMTVSPSIAEWLRDEYGLERTPALVRNIPPFSGVMPRREEGRLREL
ncbi:MAG: glycosyltransferase family 4 protein, partial [Marmoricola sp.]